MSERTDSIREPAREIAIRDECDVLVVGGGPAGIAAAVAASRNGARTILIERYGALGGLATGGLIILLLTMDDGQGQQVIAGICQELIDRLDARGAIVYPSKSDWGSQAPALVKQYSDWGLVWGRNPSVVRYAVAYDPEEFRFVANDLVQASGVKMLFHCWGARAIMDGDKITAVAIESKSGREAIKAKQVVDASGDGDVFVSAGVPYASELVHPWLWYRMAGIEDLDAIMAAGENRFFRTPPGDGRVLAPWGAAGKIDRQISGVDVEDLSYAEIACRRMVMEEVDRLRLEVPGFEKAFLTDIASQIGITESRRMLGSKVLQRESANQTDAEVVARTGNWTKAGMMYDIPFGCLYSELVENLLVAGRCISVDHRVHHSTKEIPACFATGEAAGTAAAMAAQLDRSPAAIDIRELQSTLIGNGASLGV